MVRAILEGRKTQTRRPVKQAMRFAELGVPAWRPDWCPLGVPGDELWVRETWRIGAWKPDPARFGDVVAVDYLATNGERTPWINPTFDKNGKVNDAADAQRVHLLRDAISRVKAAHAAGRIQYSAADDKYLWEPGTAPLPWHPSIHMPRWASRITLKVTDVRVQRLMDASEADIIAEGFTNSAGYQSALMKAYGDGITYANPWVWAVTFEVKS